MAFSLLDNPLILSLAFYPRTAEPGDGPRGGMPGVHDGSIPVDGAALGYRLYAHTPGAPLVVYFHGNAEIAPDYDHIAPYFQHAANASLLVVDYRGFGWSTGSPTFAALVDDCAPIVAALPSILTGAGLPPESALFVMGRSMGSAPALHIAHTFPERIQGVIIESGFADLFSVLVRLGLPAAAFGSLIDPLGNERKARELRLPLLVIHGEQDTLIPVQHGQRLYDAAPSARKELLRIPGAGHNDLLSVAPDAYFRAIAAFLRDPAPGV